MAEAFGGIGLARWQRIVAGLGVAAAYAQLGLMLAGQGPGWLLPEVVVALAMILTLPGMLSVDRQATAIGFVHMAMAALLLLCAWGFLPVALPATPEAFRALILPMIGLSFLTQGLVRGTGWPKW
jgi:hypothetical protein